MIQIREEKPEKLLKYGAIFGIAFCSILLLPQSRILLLKFIDNLLRQNLDIDFWMESMLSYSLSAIFIFCCILVIPIKNIKSFFMFASIGIVAISVIVRIIMYLKCPSLYLDEALLAENIVSRNWLELLVPPLNNVQSAPVLYVIAVKSICEIFGYSELSLRFFSLFAFVSLLICETVFMKKVFNFSNHKIAFVVVMSVLFPSYIWYSNELKPYMGDALFAVLTVLLHFYYTQNKIKLPILTALYILIFAFSSPAIFFIGGVLFSEFLIAVFNKNKKAIISISLSGVVILAIFGLYYYWWQAQISEVMQILWNGTAEENRLKQILKIFHPMTGAYGESSSLAVWFFVPFALLGFYSSLKQKNKIVYSISLALFFVFFASAIGKWPLRAGRLWLFLPIIVLIFTPIGYDFIKDKIQRKKLTDIVEFSFLPVIVVCSLINCVGYIGLGSKMYYRSGEINPLIHYVQENIKEDEKLYVYQGAVIAFKYKNGYGARIGSVTRDNIIFGIDEEEWNESVLGNELSLILENEKTYLIFQSYFLVGIDKGLAVLRNYGTLTEVMNVYDTPRYYFEKKEQK
ncbi:MAG: hypothetical protein LBQ87_01100 [Candidatus Fibromonas sp.]|jgi:hypothetical protein|nr:hypothetical protein [Candidatus Fibromonas sp.]